MIGILKQKLTERTTPNNFKLSRRYFVAKTDKAKGVELLS